MNVRQRIRRIRAGRGRLDCIHAATITQAGGCSAKIRVQCERGPEPETVTLKHCLKCTARIPANGPQITQIAQRTEEKKASGVGQNRPAQTPEQDVASPVIPSVSSAKSADLRVAGIFPAFNEGEEVRTTIESWVNGFNLGGPASEINAFVVDDGSRDNSCEAFEPPKDLPKGVHVYRPVTVVSHDRPEGVGRSRNAGLKVARDWGMDVVAFHDAHMRFPEGVIEALAVKAVESGAIVCSKAKGWWDPPEKGGKEHKFRAWGADMHWNLQYGLQPKYRVYGGRQNPQIAQIAQRTEQKKASGAGQNTPAQTPDQNASASPVIPSVSSAKSADEAWTRVPCPMGACYVMSRETVEKLMAPTGRLWDDVAGRWGFSEQALAVKAFLLDVPILVSRDLRTHHKYGANPSFDFTIQTESYRNVCYAMAALLSEETFNLRFRHYCQTFLGPITVKELSEKARRALPGPHPWTVADEQRVFTHLCGRSAPITAPHEDHAWLKENLRPQIAQITQNTDMGLVNGKAPVPQKAAPPNASVLPSASSAKSVDRLRVLQWRPGESTLLLRQALPHADITCLEWFPHRVHNWQGALKDLGVKLIQTDLNGWINPLQTGFLKREKEAGGFEFIFIGGELQDECRRAAEQLLAPGGRIVVNPTGDALQIEDAERRKAAREIEEWQKQRSPQIPRQDDPQIPQITQKEDTDRGKNRSVVAPTPSAPSVKSADRLSVTVLLLNWRRPENIMPILICLARQTARPRVAIWDNGAGENGPLQYRAREGDLRPIDEIPIVDRVIRPDANMGCFPRWWMAADCETEYVCSLDDDLMFTDPKFLEDAIAAQREIRPDGIVGLFGVRLLEGKTYKDSRHFNGRVKKDTSVDVVKGRFMLFPRRLLARVPLHLPGVEEGEDDLYVSLNVGQGRQGAHVLPKRLAGRSVQVGKEDGRSNALRPGHYRLRGDMIRRILEHHGKEWWK